ncbi:MAG: response regulator [Betaproteobacteria bacterium]
MLKVLIVDDERDTVLSLMLLLGDEGYEVKGAANAGETWRMLAQFDPDVILLDIGLPDRNGYDLAREIRARFGEHRPALVAVTAWNKGADKLLAKLAGFNHHIGKPYDPDALIGVLRSVAPA